MLALLVDRFTCSSAVRSWRVLVVLSGVCLAFAVAGPGAASASFGIASFDGSLSNRDGSPATQAGSHPYQASTKFTFNTTSASGQTVPDGNFKDLRAELPEGLIGDPSATARCPQQDFFKYENGAPQTECPADSQVGLLVLKTAGLGTQARPVFNLVPPPGEPAQLGVVVFPAPVYFDAHVRSGGDYGLTVSLSEISTLLPVFGSTLTVWGVPADPSHDALRGAHLICTGDPTNPAATSFCFGGGHSAGVAPAPFLTLPTSCAGPQAFGLSVDSWQNPGVFVNASFLTHDNFGNPIGFEGCNRLDFSPSIVVRPDTSAVDSPTGLHIDVHLPEAGLQQPEGLAEADLKNAVVTLPAGISVNPAVANGLAACSPAQIALASPEPATCPDTAKVGSVEVDTPILDHPLDGGVYVAEQGNNPFGSLLAIYIAVNDPQTGVVIKLAGHVVADPQTGQLTTTFDNNPQQPFTDLKLDFFGGSRAALVNPDACGAYTATSLMTPWSGGSPVEPSSAFEVNAGCHAPRFNPAFTAGTVNPQAGAFSPFSVSFSRSDQDQGLGAVSVKTPPGLLGILKNVERCSEPQASQGTCSAGSLIGHTTAAGGAGPDPVSVGGQVFLTGPYKGAPFGLSIVVPAVAGPFDLGTVVVRAAINIDPHTAQITVTSDSLPSILQGIPLLLKKVNVTIDRSGFMFNPTNCEPLNVGGTLSSSQGASANVASHFQAANCASLAFKPKFTVSTQAGTSKKNGASLDVNVGYPSGTQANIRSVAVTLPKQLPSRLTTIQQACPEATFAQNPASCPAGSNIGTATANTPVLASALTGPAYLVSHGGASFPDLVVILQGEGVTLDLVGSIDIKKGVTSSTFASVPDAPISSFELKLPEGPHSGLAAVLPAKARGSLCGTSLTIPTTLTAQNGAQIKQSTKIAVTGCPKAKKAKKHKRATHGKKKAKKRSLTKRS